MSRHITLRIATYNIHRGRGMDRRVNILRTAKVIADFGADLIALQEVVGPGPDGMGQAEEIAAQLGMTPIMAPTRLLRWGSIATVAEERSGMQWRTALVLYQDLRRLRAIAFEAFERGDTAAPVPLVEYGARTIYRQPFFDGRLFGELVLGYSWPRVDPALPREGSAGVTAGLELPFGARGAPAPVPEQNP